MKSNTERIEALDTIADTSDTLRTFATLILNDLVAARGEPEQQRHTRPQLLDDIRDVEPPDPAPPPHPDDDEVRDYSDPTGERAIKPDTASRDLAEIDKRLSRAKTDMAVVSRILQRHQAARTPQQIRDVRIVAERELDSEGDEWCRSHLRVHTLEPIELQKSGVPYYKGMCRRCGSLLAKLKNDHPKRFRHYKQPPIELVGIMTYRTVRESDVNALVSPQHRKSKAPKYEPGEDRKRRPA